MVVVTDVAPAHAGGLEGRDVGKQGWVGRVHHAVVHLKLCSDMVNR